ncbi:MAG: hypothetical protein QNJ15_08225 [Erythrobacter sp.]|nr:hypothetical protein [Erythrobacter sp.]
MPAVIGVAQGLLQAGAAISATACGASRKIAVKGATGDRID